jgi:hypothetical protein
MSAKTPENVIIRAIHEAFIKYPEGDGGLNLDYEWVQPEQSSHWRKPYFWSWLRTALKL